MGFRGFGVKGLGSRAQEPFQLGIDPKSYKGILVSCRVYSCIQGIEALSVNMLVVCGECERKWNLRSGLGLRGYRVEHEI